MNGNLSARLTPESKAALRKTIRDLRVKLLEELRGYAEQRYQLNVPFAKASLSQTMREHRRRLESALAERAAEEGGTTEDRKRALENAVKEAGATLLNRLVLIRHLEAVGLSRPVVVTGGWKSLGYQQFREYSPGFLEDETQGYGVLLRLLFDELAAQLPGLFGEVGLTSLFPASPATLRAVVEELDEVPAEAWRDDMTLGWVYQYWNDPDREALDKKLLDREKLEPHELASKTQMFTERYMVEWLLQNSLSPTWLAMCRKNGWVAEVEQRGILKSLDERRAEWRKKREAGAVALDALMPTEGTLEECWKYYVPQPLPDDVVNHAPASIREFKLIDPACGSGHFLVVAFDLLVEFYREEARHRGESWSDREIAEWILENNLHGVDIDPRAVQIAAAATFLKARTLAKEASPRQVNLVAPALRLSALDQKDPALLKLERDIELETGIPPELTRQLLDVLKGVDHLGTLLKVGDAVDRAINAYEGKLGKARRQGDLFAGAEDQKRIAVDKKDAKKLILERLNAFLADHSGEEDLGLRLRGRQLTAGLRFASIVRDGEYHLVVANPPYQGTSRMKDAGYIAKHYPRGKADLYAAFLERGLDLCRPGGASAMVTMRGWMFLGQFESLRTWLLSRHHLSLIADIGTGAFSSRSMDDIISTALAVVRQIPPQSSSIGIQAAPLSDPTRDAGKPDRRRASLHSQTGMHDFSTNFLSAIDGTPVIYWWPAAVREAYTQSEKLGNKWPAEAGIVTGDDTRFTRYIWEVHVGNKPTSHWSYFTMGAKGLAWFEPARFAINFHHGGLELAMFREVSKSPRFGNPEHYYKRGIAFSMISIQFEARVHRTPGLIGKKGCSLYPPGPEVAAAICLLNSSHAKHIMKSLSAGMGFEIADVNRLPLFHIRDSEAIFRQVEESFSEHEKRRETSIEFFKPGPASWEYAQQWARSAVDRLEESTLPPWRPMPDPSDATAELSFQIGVALSRFSEHGGIRDAGSASKASVAFPMLYVSARRGIHSADDTVAKLQQAFTKSGHSGGHVSVWLREGFFDYHRQLYENRPIYFPLSSAKKSFVAFISVHCWTEATLSTLLADHLLPDQRAIQGALVDMRSARNNPDRRIRAAVEKNYAQHMKWLEELEEFIQKVREVAEKGPPAPDDKTKPREVDAPYRMDIDDGVMVNSSALWPLLDPAWKDPKKWWKELANAKGRKDYDWSHLAARYFPDRVDAKCQKDPSLAVAHGGFWKYHPEKAYQWELRLQNEIGPDFKLDEKDSGALRAAFLDKQPARARELEVAEQARRERKARKQDQEELDLSEAEGDEDEEAVSA
ncbi:BREX-6 system adenine-specific DNA-methyltransferase PglX [Myxococcus sp. AM011]|uniref:BREX-6 system adenine-specific DNA-methyltransferase PglX n=1 Tax=Myxococcus sp. AM011 TaxID=2745200 RepID=UPI0015953659|nr:BREX-6 system adenine-specific DNA-methyltransferase PglX [Myxococcus sp. AM011]NVJ19970.1 BREX-6 system adenine-specific DNA-methyltransferase PglX [Myxococcus sp. AM011]